MKKSSSLQLYKVDFNPKEFKTGQSKIDQLPLKLEARRNSTSQVNTSPSDKVEIEILKRQNAILHRQNEQLRRQIEIMRSKSGVNTMIKTEEKINGYREILKNKLSNKAKSSRVTTECETGLFSSKQISLEHSLPTIEELCQNYHLTSRAPSLFDLRDISQRFFKEYCDKYSKLKMLFECLPVDKNISQYKCLRQVINRYQVPLLHQKTPETLFREISQSKQKQKRRQTEEVCWQVLSPNETVQRFESLLAKICKSSKLLKQLKGNKQVVNFIAKLQQVKR